MTPLWTLPLGGSPCAHCGQPARSMRVFPHGKRTDHTDARKPPCDSFDTVNPPRR